jgi:peroxiredoxin
MRVGRVGTWVLGVPLIATSALVLVLSNRLRDLSADYRELRRLSTLPHAGTVVPTFRTATLSGDTITVGEATDSAERQVLFIFNTTCTYCRGMIPLWHQMADSVKGLGRTVQVMAISLDSADTTRRYIAKHALRYPVLTLPQPKLERLYRAVAVPQTVVLDWTGTVLYAKTGTLDAASMDSVYTAVTGRSRQ